MDITDSCLDAETLAAWVDGGLTAPELAQAQAHVADCERCQAMVGTLVKINAAAPTAKTEATWRSWLTWLAPLAAAAAAVTIWVAIPGSNLDSRVTAPVVTMPQAPAQSTEPSSSQLPSEAKAKDQAAQPLPAQTAAPTATAPAATSPATMKTDAAASAQEMARTTAQAPPPASEATSLMDAKKERSEVAAPARPLDQIGGVVGGIPPGASPVQPPAAPAPARADTIAGNAPTVTTQTGQAANFTESARGTLQRNFASPAEIISPDPMVRWRIAGANANNVERTTNGGAAWEATQTGVTTPLTSGAAPSPTAVWIVGRSGVVILSTDGRTWRRLSSPAITDLASVRARDARTATVTATDGRIFSTIDAGTTWTPGPLQGF